MGDVTLSSCPKDEERESALDPKSMPVKSDSATIKKRVPTSGIFGYPVPTNNSYLKLSQLQVGWQAQVVPAEVLWPVLTGEH